MRFPAPAVLAVMIGGLSADAVYAQQFQWNSPFWGISISGDGAYSYTFSDNPNGGSLSGNASAGYTQSGTNGGAAYATTTFTRPLTVSGSAGGWQLQFNYNANGYVQALHGTGYASLSARVDGQQVFFREHMGGGGGGPQFPFNWSAFPIPPTVNVANGNHTIEIIHRVGGNTPGPPFSFPGSFGFGNIQSYSVDVMAIAVVPEPQFLAAVLALAGFAMRHRRPRREP